MIRRHVGWAIAALVFAIDQFSKWYVTGPLALPQRDSVEILPIFRLQWVANHGISMGKLVASSAGQRWALTLFTVGIAVFVAVRAVMLGREVLGVLGQHAPAGMDAETVATALARVAGVSDVHDLHVWTLTSGREAMSAHVAVDDVRESERLLETLHALLHARFGIDHTTIQLEMEPPAVLRIQGPGSAQAAGSS